MSYKHNEIDQKWQKYWEDNKTFQTESQGSGLSSGDGASFNKKKPKFYALDMFPYPSGSGLHVGHLASYTPTDIISHYKRAKGFNVLHPMGYDAFGLPAEQYAIQTGVHPAITTQKAIQNFRRQLQSFGFSFDWNREISTAEPSYYKWTQFIFLKLFERGLAYQKEVPVNWCPALKTVLANEEVVDGKSERGGHPVVRQPMKQWMLKITHYAERLLNDLDKVDWPTRTKEAQKNWIGKSEGAEIEFKIKDSKERLDVFTTRPDTLFGVTFMVLAPEHPAVAKITTDAQKSEVDHYIQQTAKMSEVDRKANTKKSGAFTGAYAINGASRKEIPIFISDYVLMDYGTGAIMAVPGHDERDFDMALKVVAPYFKAAPEKFILRVLKPEGSSPATGIEGLPFVEDGVMVNSEFLDGFQKSAAIQKVFEFLDAHQMGRRLTQYKLRDWLFSRQRYWGEPFPIVNFSQKGLKGVPETELPVMLPEVADYEPSEKGEAPLAKIKDWVNYTAAQPFDDIAIGEKGLRESDTMPGAAGSSWYFLRYTDPKNDQAPFSFEAQKYWMPVDLYVGGPEHTVGHLLYSRFWMKVLFDAGLVSHEEPFQKLAHQGMILGPDGEKMSKSRGNTVNPDDVRLEYGADAIRLYVTFLGPVDKDKPWSTSGIDGVRRFLERLWRLIVDENGNMIATEDAVPEELNRLLHKTIKKVTKDIETMGYNTAISSLMILLNELYRLNVKPKSVLKTMVQLLMPFAPHISEELWQKMGGTSSVCLTPWPSHDESLVQEDSVTMGVQVNGKMRGTIEIKLTANEEQAVKLALAVDTVAAAVNGTTPKKIIYKAGKILNLIV